MEKNRKLMLPLSELLEIYDETDDPDIRETMRMVMLDSVRQDLELSLLTLCRPRKRLLITEIGS